MHFRLFMTQVCAALRCAALWNRKCALCCAVVCSAPGVDCVLCCAVKCSIAAATPTDSQVLAQGGLLQCGCRALDAPEILDPKTYIAAFVPVCARGLPLRSTTTTTMAPTILWCAPSTLCLTQTWTQQTTWRARLARSSASAPQTQRYAQQHCGSCWPRTCLAATANESSRAKAVHCSDALWCPHTIWRACMAQGLGLTGTAAKGDVAVRRVCCGLLL